MTALAELAWLITARRYALPVVADTPKSGWMFAMRYGTIRKLVNYWAVARDYRRKRVQVGGSPCTIRVDPASACNLRCPLCPTGAGEIGRDRTFMSLDVFEQIMTEFGPRAFLVHLWVWGEPLLHRDLWRMVACATAHGVGTEISTNLSVKLTDDQIDRLITAGLTWLVVSADGASPETYEQYRRGGDFNLVVSNMRRFAARKKTLRSRIPFIEWQFVPFRHNEHEMADVVRLARDAGVNGVRFKPARVDKINNLTFAGDVPVSLAGQWFSDDPRLRHALNARDDSYHPFHCPFLWKSVTIRPDGAVAPCCEVSSRADDIGRFEPHRFADLWNGDAYVTARMAALGRETPNGKRVTCHGCKVFRKPERPALRN